ncbi:RluA family pseudouridine synthase [Halobacillus litoralis]|uniref:RluA family pseudouridine synthase n=1 Tax=Halobacillus litoralis TaxID=45668 RepID=UPI00136861A0|nr:RluA family pseudouridine synthase [Halobacillus litoralis]MYL38274.1 RluA family pseudouridine synthase [Halobacillus litoralis]
MKTTRDGEWLNVIIPHKWDGLTIEKILTREWHVPRKLMHRFRSNNEVMLNGAFPHYKTTSVHTGDHLLLRLFGPEPLEVTPASMPIDPVYEDDHLLVINKPAGVFTHPNRPDEHDTLVNGAAGYFQRRGIPSTPKYVHRLDRDTSGAILFAKHPLATAMLGREIKERKIKRTYLAWVHGRLLPEQGKIIKPIAKDPDHTVKRMVREDGRYAETHYTVLSYDALQDCSLVMLQLETGRTHQIRVHLSAVGYPLIGDTLYGGKGNNHYKQALHAARLTFVHPFTEETIHCYAPPAPSSALFTDTHIDILKQTKNGS